MLDNIAFFEIHNKAIAKALKDTLQGKNCSYQLFFDISDINIINLQTNKFIYPKDSFINLSLEIAQNPLNNAMWSIQNNDFHLAKIEVKNLYITAESINQMVDYTKRFLHQSGYHLPSLFLPQTNIFGLCGGLFLQLLLEQGFYFHSLFIFEEDIELFSIACYFVDFKQLFSQVGDKSCYIFIENLVSKSLIWHYFYHKKITNNFLCLRLSVFVSSKISHIQSIVEESYKMNSRGWGSFEDEMIGVKNTLQNIKKTKIFTHSTNLKVPICVVGSGPSLESNIEFLRQNQNKMLIFSCGTALKILKSHHIDIDFQIEIERVPYLDSVLRDSALGDSVVLCASVVDTKVLDLAQKVYLFFRGGSASAYIAKNGKAIEFGAPFVGNMGFSLACNLSDEIILLGIDCGYIKGRAKHSRGSFYGNEESEIPSDCFQVKGNGECEVYSNSMFSLSRENIELAIKHYKPKRVYNIGDGAFIQGTESKKNIILRQSIDKDSIKAKLLQCFSDNVEIDESLNDKVINFVASLENLICVDIATKQELFIWIDSITDFLADRASKEPFCGILFCGSVSHLLQNMMVCLLSAKTNDIKEYCKFYTNEIIRSLKQMLKVYQSSIIFS